MDDDRQLTPAEKLYLDLAYADCSERRAAFESLDAKLTTMLQGSAIVTLLLGLAIDTQRGSAVGTVAAEGLVLALFVFATMVLVALFAWFPRGLATSRGAGPKSNDTTKVYTFTRDAIKTLAQSYTDAAMLKSRAACAAGLLLFVQLVILGVVVLSLLAP